MTRNLRETRMPADLLDDVRYVACSPQAQHLYLVTRMLADDEGRFAADPPVVAANGRLGAYSAEDLGGYFEELQAAGLVVLYRHDGRAYGFLPDRFTERTSMKYWSSSVHPLPPASVRERYPNYVEGLRRLDGRGRLAYTGQEYTDRRDGPRYRVLWDAALEVPPALD
jgi:hypothetical protein